MWSVRLFNVWKYGCLIDVWQILRDLEKNMNLNQDVYGQSAEELPPSHAKFQFTTSSSPALPHYHKSGHL